MRVSPKNEKRIYQQRRCTPQSASPEQRDGLLYEFGGGEFYPKDEIPYRNMLV
jgi:hypothetical protein